MYSLTWLCAVLKVMKYHTQGRLYISLVCFPTDVIPDLSARFRNKMIICCIIILDKVVSSIIKRENVDYMSSFDHK